MRFIVYGLGAIGGAVAAHLAEAGAEVAGVARGRHLEKIRADGLRLLTPTRSTTVRFPVADDPAALRPGPDDVVILAVKSQDSAGALAALIGAGRDMAVACFQNGVANERAAARYFERVYGAVVMCPATHLEPGVVAVHSAGIPALFDVGCYPAGVDDTVGALVAALAAAGFDPRAVPDIMRWKHTKLLLNLGNAAEALTGVNARQGRLAARAREEGAACLEAAGIPFASATEDRERRGDKLADLRPAGGQPHLGSSTWQSLARGSGSTEADWLNGEIVLLGRLSGFPTPVNALLQRLTAEFAAAGRPPGTLTEDEILATLALDHRPGADMPVGGGSFAERAEAVIRALRPGEVVTYGEVAADAGTPGAARAVGHLLATRPADLPWWRVVAASGRLVPGHEAEHARRLEAEGVPLAAGKVRLRNLGRGPWAGGGPTR